VTEAGRVTRQAMYRVSDNFLAFYLQIVSRFRGEIERGLGESILPVVVDCLDGFMGSRWEEMFRAHLRALAVAGELDEQIVAVGSWWNDKSDVEIDAVALAGRERRPVLAGEAKWGRSVDGRRLVRDLRTKAAAVPGADPDTMRYALCARKTVRSAPAGTLVCTADDIFAR
jgi:hypothetical protein